VLYDPSTYTIVDIYQDGSVKTWQLAPLASFRRKPVSPSPVCGAEGKGKVHPYSTRSRQRGAVLLLAVLFLVIGSSFMLLKGLNASPGTLRAYRQQYDAKVLAQGKQALLGYAAAYPELTPATPPNRGPGRLPCPDRDNDGDINAGTCSIGAGSSVGRLPWLSLGLPPLIDSSGQRLWYAVSNEFRNTPALIPINSEVGGGLSVDGQGDIVAVIFAPGSTVQAQTRDPGNINNRLQYLEGGNEVVGTALFVGRVAGDPEQAVFNDQVAYITRAELMAVVEKRVLGDVRNGLNRYFDDPDYDDDSYPVAGGSDLDCAVDTHCDDGFAWLSTWGNPKTTAFKSQPGVREGQLPFHYSADTPTILPAPANPRNPFRTAFSMSWDINNATLGITAAGPAGRHPQAPPMPSCDPPTDACNDVLVRPPDACATDSDCDGSPLNVGVLQGTCIWSNVANPRDNMNCTASIDRPPTTETIVVGGLPVVGTRERNYTFTFTFDDNVDDDGDGIPEAEVVAATGGASRVRSLNHDNTDPFVPPTAAATITVTDTFTDNSGLLAPMVGWVTLTHRLCS